MSVARAVPSSGRVGRRPRRLRSPGQHDGDGGDGDDPQHEGQRTGAPVVEPARDAVGLALEPRAQPAARDLLGPGVRDQVVPPVVDEVEAGEDEQDAGHAVDPPHGRAQPPQEAAAGQGQRHRERGEQEAHAQPVGHDHEHPRERPVAGEAAEHGQDERPDRAAERGDGVGDPEDEHRPRRPGPSAPVQLRRREGQRAPEQEGDAEADEQEADDDAQVADDVGHAVAAGADHEAEHGEDGEEAGRHRRADQQGPAEAGLGRLVDRGVALDPQEVREVGREHGEPARVDRGDDARQEGQGERAVDHEG